RVLLESVGVGANALPIVEGGLIPTREPSGAAVRVVSDGHVEVERRRPEAVVLRRGVALAAREPVQQYAFETLLGAVLQLPQRAVEACRRDDAHGEEAIGRGG